MKTEYYEYMKNELTIAIADLRQEVQANLDVIFCQIPAEFTLISGENIAGLCKQYLANFERLKARQQELILLNDLQGK